jgi:hypothetical protein
MKRLFAALMCLTLTSTFVSLARADDDPKECAEAVKLFKDAGQSADFFKTSYGYAVFPTIGKAGLGIGGAHGSGASMRKASRLARPR